VQSLQTKSSRPRSFETEAQAHNQGRRRGAKSP